MPEKVKGLEKLGRVRLSDSFFMRDMLYSEIANAEGLPNIPDFPDVAIMTGRKLCEILLEPLQNKFGRVSIRSAYRSPSVNQHGNENNHNCASNEANYAAHIWDYPDSDGYHGATACIVVNRYIDYFEKSGDWQSLAWWIHDHLPYSSLYFFPKLCAFNINWHEKPKRTIKSYVKPRGILTKPGMDNHDGLHTHLYSAMLSELEL